MRNIGEYHRRHGRLLLGAVAIALAINAPTFAQQASVANVAASESTSQARWIPTGNLNVARWGHTATLLPNGKVLVVGGANADFAWDPEGGTSAELYDPATGSWTLTASTHFGRLLHTATLLSDGRVLVVGVAYASDGAYETSAEVYDPVTGTWTLTGSTHDYYTGHTATRMADGRVLVIGTDAKGEVYDPAAGTWSVIAPTTLNLFHTATALGDGTVLLLGGQTLSPCDDSEPRAKAYDPRTDTWSSLLDGLVTSRDWHVAMLLASGKVLVAGGEHLICPKESGERYPIWSDSLQSAELYDPATTRSTPTDSLKFAREGAAATQLSNGDVLVTGGLHMSTPPGDIRPRATYVMDAETYDAKAEQWRPAGRQNTLRYQHTATLLQDGRVLVAGGGDGGDIRFASAELYYSNLPSGTISPGFTGSWYDPAQIGHGLFVEVLPDNRFLAAWFTFDPAGTAQSWFLGVGTYSGDTAIVANVIQPTGGRWIPNFDPTHIANIPWGTLTFTFTDCNHGKVEFASTAGYGTGSMNLTRLTQPAGLACS